MDAEREVYKLLRPFGITKKYIGVSQLTLALLILLDAPSPSMQRRNGYTWELQSGTA